MFKASCALSTREKQIARPYHIIVLVKLIDLFVNEIALGSVQESKHIPSFTTRSHYVNAMYFKDP